MNNLKNFQSNEDYTYFINGGTWKQPNVSLVRSPKKVYYKKINENPHYDTDYYFTLICTKSGTLTFYHSGYMSAFAPYGTQYGQRQTIQKNIKYRKNRQSWITITASVKYDSSGTITENITPSISVTIGDVIELKATDGNVVFAQNSSNGDFCVPCVFAFKSDDAEFQVYGNTMSLFVGDDYKTNKIVPEVTFSYATRSGTTGFNYRTITTKTRLYHFLDVTQVSHDFWLPVFDGDKSFAVTDSNINNLQINEE